MLCTSYFLALIARCEFRNCGYWSSATVLELMSDAYQQRSNLVSDAKRQDLREVKRVSTLNSEIVICNLSTLMATMKSTPKTPS